MSTSQRCLVTGASGYIGGRSVPARAPAGAGVAASPSLERRTADAARVYAAAAASAGVKRIVYLGGIVAGPADALSPHLRSPGEVGDILQSSRVPPAVLHAA